MTTLSFFHTFQNDSAKITHWDICADGAIILSGGNIKSLIEALQGIKGTVFCYDLSRCAPFLHWYCVENEIDYDVFEMKSTYYTFRLKKCELKGATNFFDFEEPRTPQELESKLIMRFTALKSYISEAGALYTLKSIDKKCTIGGVAWSCFKEMSKFEVFCPKIYGKQYNLLFPYYRGGFVYAKPGEYRNVWEIDNNGLYTYVYKNYPMPFGNPVFCNKIEDLERFDFKLYHITAEFKLKPGFIPIIAQRNRVLTIDTEYIKSGRMTLFVTQYDLELIAQFYDIEFEFVNGYGFRTIEGKFNNFADFWTSKKKNDELKSTIKFMLNIPSGKAAARGIYENKEYKIVDGILTHKIKEIQQNAGGYEYIPLAIAITSIARYILISTAQKIGFDRIAYMDTDSIKFTGDFPEWVNPDPLRLGAWKIEQKSRVLKVIGKKCYIHYSDFGALKAVISGVTDEAIEEYGYNAMVSPRAAQKAINDFNEEKTITQKIKTPCKGGLHDVYFERRLSGL